MTAASCDQAIFFAFVTKARKRAPPTIVAQRGKEGTPTLGGAIVATAVSGDWVPLNVTVKINDVPVVLAAVNPTFALEFEYPGTVPIVQVIVADALEQFDELNDEANVAPAGNVVAATTLVTWTDPEFVTFTKPYALDGEPTVLPDAEVEIFAGDIGVVIVTVPAPSF